ncbi:hypothetical protein CTI12_AA523740 [Artemisia annua]|uniref:Uncharacterized protein n=1 Tax=Artemisia annua TaxID=35608 RepID=A0A2U1L769_ARTAN|nr:hypothetical protein CTI12_AA523740 [Artemisia annua]
MKVKRKVVPNRAAKDIPIQTSHPLGSHSFCHYEVSTSSSVNDLGVRHVGHDGAGWVSFPVVSTGIQSNGASSLSCCDSAAAFSSRDLSTMEIGDEGGGYVVVNAGQNPRLNEAHLLDPVLPCQVDRPDGVPVQAQTVDGSVSTFQIANIVIPFHVATRQPAISQVYNAGCAGHVPMVLDFSAGHVVRSPNFSASAQPNNNMNARQIGIPARPTRQPGQPCMRNPDAPPVQGPIAPPQREGAPLDYKCFGRYNQVCQHCGALLARIKENGLTYFCGTAVSTVLCCWPCSLARALRESIIEGLVEFLDHNNALVKLFRTARDKLGQADIPNFSIRLFGVLGVSQYELRTANSIGAIVYEVGPETMTDYDVVIQRHSGEPESVNKLHPVYMALQFPLLFIYDEEGYHLKLTLMNVDGDNQQQEKKMSMKSPVTSNTPNINTFSEWLLAVGNGTAGYPDEADPDNTSWVKIPDQYCIENTDHGLVELVNFIYDRHTLETPTAQTLQQKAIVCPKNETVDMINEKVLDIVQSEGRS